jgi:hypothetical protein
MNKYPDDLFKLLELLELLTDQLLTGRTSLNEVVEFMRREFPDFPFERKGPYAGRETVGQRLYRAFVLNRHDPVDYAPTVEDLVELKLRDAFELCHGDDLIHLYRRPVAGVGSVSQNPNRVFLTAQGRGVLARRRMEGTTPAKPRPQNGAKGVKPEDVPPECRELGQPNGSILSATYLAENTTWDISSKELSQATKAGELTYRIKVGHAFVYRYDELCQLRDRLKARKKL